MDYFAEMETWPFPSDDGAEKEFDVIDYIRELDDLTDVVFPPTQDEIDDYLERINHDL